MLRRKLGSFLVPDVSFLSLGFLPGTFGSFPLFQIVGPRLSAASAGDTADDDMVPAVTATAATILWKNALLSIMLSSASKSASL